MNLSIPRVAAAAGLLALAASLVGVTPAQAAIIPTVQLGTAAEYSVIGGSTVTNTGPSLLNQSLGVHPGLAATG
ncbi:MAG: hypothetical protein HZB15_11845, partial [Actinobacteria bacterium]|nr:hypothetical protein [Actinomycetota bacterium]